MITPKPITPDRLSDIENCVLAWSGKCDANGNLAEGPEWDTEQIVDALADLLAAYKHTGDRAEPYGYSICRGGMYMCNDRHDAGKTWWGEWSDPFKCAFDSKEGAGRYMIPGDSLVEVLC